MTTKRWRHDFGPSVASKVASKKLALATQLLGLGIHVVHEFVDKCDGDLLNLRLRIRDLADKDVPGGVDAAFCIGVEHDGFLSGELIERDVVLDIFRNERAVFRRNSTEVFG